MRFSRYFLPTLKETPSDAQIVSHRFMLRSGMIRQTASGIYTWLPLGLKVLKNIENIIRQEHEKANVTELLMPTIQSADLWRQSGRYDAYGPEMLRFTDRHEREMLYGPTNEEMITDIAKNTLKSYKNLPKILYHMQWKFRDEIRPRFGVMRGREFLMKDAYSFDLTPEDAELSYKKMMALYVRIFAKLGLVAVPMKADTGPIGGDLSHEFLVLAETGESQVFFDRTFIKENSGSAEIDYDNRDVLEDIFKRNTSLYAATEEKHNEADFNAQVSVDNRVSGRGIEVGHIFMFGTKYSLAMGANVTNIDGVNVPMQMGSYGIGVSRLVAALIEASHDEDGIIWNKAVTPFQVGLVNLRQDFEATDNISEILYAGLQKAGLSVLYHDTDDRAGNKFSDMDLIGLPYRLAVGPKGVEKGLVEIKSRATKEIIELTPDEAISFLVQEYSTY